MGSGADLFSSRIASGNLQGQRRRETLKDEALICQQAIVMDASNDQVCMVFGPEVCLLIQPCQFDSQADGSFGTSACNETHRSQLVHCVIKYLDCENVDCPAWHAAKMQGKRKRNDTNLCPHHNKEH